MIPQPFQLVGSGIIPASLYHRGFQGGIERRGCQQILSTLDVKCYPSELLRLDVPPACNGDIRNHLRNQVGPDQRLFSPRAEKVLLGFGNGIGQGDERSSQSATGAYRPSAT